MILTCPECATSYFVDDAQLGSGRTVRCASCGASWRANPPLELTVTPEEGALAVEAAATEAPEDRPAAELPADDLARVFRARAHEHRHIREAATQGAVWAGLGAAFALVVAAAMIFRVEVVRIWPKAASAYAAVGLPVNWAGLTIEDVHAQPSLQDGHPALVVSGVLRNIRGKPVTAPPLVIALLDKQGKRLLTRTATPGDPLVPAGQTRSFAISLVDPPSAASDLEVNFHVAASAPPPRRAPAPKLRPAPAPATPASTNAMLLGPPVRDAAPLPADSPYALRPPPGDGASGAK